MVSLNKNFLRFTIIILLVLIVSALILSSVLPYLMN
ncbi:stressosome-associated protein Prli42 [Macrococcoides caseolyticum]